MKNINETVKFGTPEISILVNYSNRAKNYSIHISNINNTAKLTIPVNGSYHQAISFAKSRETWIRDKLANHLPEISPEFGSDLLYRGQKLKIKKLSIETGASEFFAPARKLFENCGFEQCAPFAHYKEDANSLYLTKLLDNR